MTANRLDGVLERNRKHLVRDFALAAFLLVALLFTGLTFGAQLPKLSMARTTAPAQLETPCECADRADAVANYSPTIATR